MVNNWEIITHMNFNSICVILSQISLLRCISKAPECVSKCSFNTHSVWGYKPRKSRLHGPVILFLVLGPLLCGNQGLNKSKSCSGDTNKRSKLDGTQRQNWISLGAVAALQHNSRLSAHGIPAWLRLFCPRKVKVASESEESSKNRINRSLSAGWAARGLKETSRFNLNWRHSHGQRLSSWAAAAVLVTLFRALLSLYILAELPKGFAAWVNKTRHHLASGETLFSSILTPPPK